MDSGLENIAATMDGAPDVKQLPEPHLSWLSAFAGPSRGLSVLYFACKPAVVCPLRVRRNQS